MEQTNPVLSDKEKNKFRIRREIGAFLVLMLLFTGYRLLFKKKEVLEGIYTIGQSVTLKDGGSHIPGMQYQYNNLTYTGKLTKDAQAKIGNDKEFIIIMIDGDPTKPNIIGVVPDCFKNVAVPSEGWKEMPSCK
jgi:hypothetical protein